MRSNFFLAVIIGLFIGQYSMAQQHDFLSHIDQFIEDPGVFTVNQEPGHVPLVPFSNAQEAMEGNWSNSSGYQSLNGQWKFQWQENPYTVPKDFFERNYKDSNWDDINVPGNWEMQGYGDPVFRNVSQPFPSDPPSIPHDYNPTGTYRKYFSIPANWKNRKIFLRIEAATSASFVWVNGKEVGYNQGANEPAEYDITELVKPGKNVLAIMVTKYSDGTYLEDQDFWRLAGIFRDVYLLATPQVHIRDYYITSDLDDQYKNATFNCLVELRNYNSQAVKGFGVQEKLFFKNVNTPIITLKSDPVDVGIDDKTMIHLSGIVSDPNKWSAEFPNLYHIILELIDPDGKVVEVLGDRIGFKKVEVKHQAIFVNGVPIKLNGVNSHMQHPELGHTMNVETIRKDFTLMKQFNINCVRTSHYPPNIEYLNLADEMGIYIVDETGDESHATQYVSEKPEWRDAYVDRVTGMVLRDRNHPSIIFWSAGNESGEGNNICEVIREGKRLDPTRIFMYGGNTDDAAWKNEVPCEDIIGPRYPTPYELKTRVGEVPESQDPRPSFMDEYVAATGNGAGALDEYWDLIYAYPRISGGAVWDWVSPGIREPVRLLMDDSQNHINTSIKGRGKLVEGKFGKAVALSGYDEWIETYRDPALDITGNQLTLSMWLYPRKWNGYGPLITKGSYQFGLNQFAEDSLMFYLTGNHKVELSVALPDDWTDHWHHLAGIYDGQTMDNLILMERKWTVRNIRKSIANKPFPVNIGWISDIDGQEYPGKMSNAIFDRTAIFNRAIPIDELFSVLTRFEATCPIVVRF